ncbi:MAG: 50S ribosomal protein L4 [Candidatus Hodarchaeales archaeon]
MSSQEGTVSIRNLEGAPTGQKLSLPSIFSTVLRSDVIGRAVVASQANRMQPHGTNPRAGKKTSAASWGTGHGMARVPRVKGSRHPRGSQGALAPFTVGGRKTHPPVVNKNYSEKINRKERQMAIRSAIAATANPVLVETRGHIVDEVPELPLVVIDDFEEIARTAEASNVLASFGIWPDIEKAKKRRSKIRAGRGSRRGRRHRSGKSVLVVTNRSDAPVIRAMRNLSGVDAVPVKSLNAELLAPGTHPGRLVLWTESAFRALDNPSFAINPP